MLSVLTAQCLIGALLRTAARSSKQPKGRDLVNQKTEAWKNLFANTFVLQGYILAVNHSAQLAAEPGMQLLAEVEAGISMRETNMVQRRVEQVLHFALGANHDISGKVTRGSA